jgi:hypothetical protein
MKAIFVIHLALFLAFSSCFSNNNSYEKKEPDSHATVNVSNSDTIHPALLKVIDEFIIESKKESALDSMNKNRYQNKIGTNIFLIQFGKLNSDCYLELAELQYVNKKNSMQYLKYKNCLLVFYNIAGGCNLGFVNPNFLLKDIPKGFPDETSNMGGSFEPLSHWYTIHSIDSIQRIKEPK